ncbi:MAG: succinate dehydrogenase cytochrome b subunit [Fuerstiella sp.]
MNAVYKILGLPAELLCKVPGIGPIVKVCCTSVGQKILMALTGLSLCGFLVAHLGGNLNLFAGKDAFNGYAEKLHSLGPLLAVAEVGLFATFLLHIGLAVSTTAMSRAARKNEYEKKATKQSGFILPNGGASNLMLVTGLIVFAYLVVHILDMKLNVRGFPGASEIPGEGDKFEHVRAVLLDFKTAVFYAVCMLALGIHLSHGVRSACQSLGISHPRWNKLISIGGVLFAWLIAAGFTSIVVWPWAVVPH